MKARTAGKRRPRIRPLPLPGGRRLRWRWVVLLVVGVPVAAVAFPPTRAFASAALSRVVFDVTSPLAPGMAGFTDLSATTKVVAADGKVLAQFDGTQSLDKVQLKDLPPVVPHAVLAAEDARFYQEAAIDPAGVARALFQDFARSATQGGSTITQQLAKINYTGSRRTILRKFQELLFADELARHYTKDQLLDRYLNQVYFGDGAYGVAAAAKTFFDETPQQLTAPQAAMLAGKIRSPEGLNPLTRPHETTVRRNEVLRAMAEHGWLPAGQLPADLSAPLGLKLQPPTSDPGPAPAFVDYVRAEAAGIPQLGSSPDVRLRAFDTGGYTIYTTLDTGAVRTARSTVQQLLGSPGDPTASVVSVQPGDGAIRLIFGGLGTTAAGFDPAVDGHRQPGSAMKPFVYLAALEAGIDPRSVLAARSPMTIDYRGAPWHVHNYEPGQPTATIDEGLAKSINTVFAQLVAVAGPDKVVQLAEEAGLPTSLDLDRNNPSVALGALTRGVSPLDMATAYATLAADGTWAAPYSISRIVDRHGREIYRHVTTTRQALDPKEVAVLTRAMIGVVDHGTGTAANIGRPLAGKTGTTENFGDAWFAGFTPQLTTAVWVGHLRGPVPMTDVHGISVAGGTFPARIFAAVMRVELAGRPVVRLATAPPDALALSPFSQVASGNPPGPRPAPANPATTTSSSSTTTSSSTTSSTTTSTTSTTVPGSGNSPPTTAYPTTTTTSTTVATGAGGTTATTGG